MYRNERALWSKSKTWNKLTFSDLPLGGKSDPLANLPCRRVAFSVFRFTWVKLMMNPLVSLWSKSCKWYTTLHSIQLYICCHFMYCVIWSWASGQVSHAFISMENFCQFQLFYYVVVVAVVVVYYTTTSICCCVIHNNNDNYKIHINWLWGLC